MMRMLPERRAFANTGVPFSYFDSSSQIIWLDLLLTNIIIPSLFCIFMVDLKAVLIPSIIIWLDDRLCRPLWEVPGASISPCPMSLLIFVSPSDPEECRTICCSHSGADVVMSFLVWDWSKMAVLVVAIFLGSICPGLCHIWPQEAGIVHLFPAWRAFDFWSFNKGKLNAGF